MPANLNLRSGTSKGGAPPVASMRDAKPPSATPPSATLPSGNLYAAVKARDARFDGRFFVGVTSTGVYCRPVCRVRTPLFRNCRFFGNAASAECAGFRPCLRCRPELAPGLAFVDSSRALAQAAARLMTQAVLAGEDVRLPVVAARLGVTDRHLRRIFAAEHGVAPLDFVTTQRLLHAKQLLTDTELPVTQVALASGFASVRRFNAAFAERYRLSPSAVRRSRTGPNASLRADTDEAEGAGAITLRLGYRPPYDIAGVMRFLARRQVSGLESVDAEGLSWRRTLAVPHAGDEHKGWIAMHFCPERHEVDVALAPSLLPALGTIGQRVRQALDLDADPALVDPTLTALPGAPIAGVRVPGAIDGFEAAVRVVLGQQVSVAAARTLTQRLVHALGEPIETPFADLGHVFPSAHRLAHATPDAIGRLGIVGARVRALQALARAVDEGHVALHPAAPLQATLEALRALPGFGEWTVQLIALRALGWPDAFAASDIGVMQALSPLTGGVRDAAAAAALAERWRPWRGYALIRLWLSLES
jgi:AraC family transcriptional regulator of adaptative response / DNA-3-methyladenine glycosylase II